MLQYVNYSTSVRRMTSSRVACFAGALWNFVTNVTAPTSKTLMITRTNCVPISIAALRDNVFPGVFGREKKHQKMIASHVGLEPTTFRSLI